MSPQMDDQVSSCGSGPLAADARPDIADIDAPPYLTVKQLEADVWPEDTMR